jgi:hypothetical protein
VQYLTRNRLSLLPPPIATAFPFDAVAIASLQNYLPDLQYSHSYLLIVTAYRHERPHVRPKRTRSVVLH